MAVSVFENDERGYQSWLAANPDGFVLNIRGSLNPVDARVHSAACRTISGSPPRGSTWTGAYIKVCSPSKPALQAWIAQNVAGGPAPCRVCAPG